MEKGRIKNVCIHRVPIDESQQKQTDEKLAEYYVKSVKYALDQINISDEQKADVVKLLLCRR